MKDKKTKEVKKEKKLSEVEELKNQVARALADYDNLRKRVEAEKESWETIAASKVALKLLPIFDMLGDAQKHLQDSGLEIVLREFRETLLGLGVEEIKVKPGDEFDPLLEEVVETVKGGKANTISEVVQSGWKIKNEAFIIRPAKVIVFGKEISEA